jgi:hypothetical protein
VLCAACRASVSPYYHMPHAQPSIRLPKVRALHAELGTARQLLEAEKAGRVLAEERLDKQLAEGHLVRAKAELAATREATRSLACPYMDPYHHVRAHNPRFYSPVP